MQAATRKIAARMRKLVERVERGEIGLHEIIGHVSRQLKESVPGIVPNILAGMMSENPQLLLSMMRTMPRMAEVFGGKRAFIQLRGEETRMIKVIHFMKLDEFAGNPLDMVKVTDGSEAEIEAEQLPGVVIDPEIFSYLFNWETLPEVRLPGLTGEGILPAMSAIAQGDLVRFRRTGTLVGWFGGMQEMIAFREEMGPMQREMGELLRSRLDASIVAPIIEATLERCGC